MKKQYLFLIIPILAMFLLLNSFAENSKPKLILTKADLPDGYYLNTNHTDSAYGESIHQETWSTRSNSEDDYYVKKYGNTDKAPPISIISVDIYLEKGKITDRFINFHKGSGIDPNWKEITPKGKSYGDKFWYLAKQFQDGDSSIKVVIVKKNKLCSFYILHK
ncbi:MAG: hypothetical protein LWY06_03945, partial [Firmicutes bacterium]|nr:hypothetical protein [Bacillota bacterium]